MLYVNLFIIAFGIFIYSSYGADISVVEPSTKISFGESLRFIM
jgi:hypothetical protein